MTITDYFFREVTNTVILLLFYINFWWRDVITFTQ